MCEHLIELENAIKAEKIIETYRGTPWSKNCREWVYFDCVLDLASLRVKYQLNHFIIDHSNDDIRSGLEMGFVCTQCHDAVIGVHPNLGRDKIRFK